MKRRIPLYFRIILILVVNLVVAALLLDWVLKSHYGLGKDDVVASTVERRMEGMTKLLIPALEAVELDQWGDVLSETGETHGVELALYRPNGSRRYAGSQREVSGTITDFLGKKFPRDRPDKARIPGLRPDGAARGPRRMSDLLDGPPDDERPPRRKPFPPRRGPGADAPSKNPDRAGRVEVEKIGRFGKPKTEMAVVHFWIKPSENKPHDLILLVWKTDSASQVFFSWQPLFITFAGLLLLSALLWVPFVYRITRRLGILTRGAESISEGNFNIDVASDRGDELGRLSRSIQRMSSRLDEYVSGQKRFLGDIAHELCSPLVRIRMGLGVLEHQMGKEELAKLEDIGEVVEELSQLVNELLDFSKASLHPERLEMDSVDIPRLCKSVVAREAPDEDIHVHASEPLVIKSREDLLRRAIGNVVRNAVRYAAAAGPINVCAEQKSNEVIISVDDVGPGLPEEWLEKIFEPFSRPEDARTREGGGSGLGLAIAKTCVTSLGGEIRCHNREEGGLSVVMTFPDGDSGVRV